MRRIRDPAASCRERIADCFLCILPFHFTVSVPGIPILRGECFAVAHCSILSVVRGEYTIISTFFMSSEKVRIG